MDRNEAFNACYAILDQLGDEDFAKCAKQLLLARMAKSSRFQELHSQFNAGAVSPVVPETASPEERAQILQEAWDDR